MRAAELFIALLNRADSEQGGEETEEEISFPLLDGRSTEVVEGLLRGPEIPEEHHRTAESTKGSDRMFTLLFGNDRTPIPASEELLVRFVKRIVPANSFARGGWMGIPIAWPQGEVLFIHENITVDCKAVASTDRVLSTVDRKMPPIAGAEAHGGSLGFGELLSQEVRGSLPHKKDVIVADPADAPMGSDGSEKFITFCRSVEVEEFLHAGMRELFGMQIPGAVEDCHIHRVSEVLLHEMIPHRHHGGEDIHREERWLLRRW